MTSGDEPKSTDESLQSLALFPDENPNPVLRISTDGRLLYANKAAELLGSWVRQAGQLASAELHGMVLEVLASGAAKEIEVRSGDRVFSLDCAPIPARGYANLYGRDATAQKRAETELQKLNRTLQAHTRSAHVMMRARNEAEHLQEVCRIVAEDCGYAMVWIGYAEQDAGKTVRPLAHFGLDEGYLEKLNVTWADTERGRGPTGTAIRTGKPCGCRNVRTDSAFAPWREAALKRGYASSLALPLTADGKAFGAITIYSREPDAFSEDEVKLLSALAEDLAFGIASLRLREANARAGEALRRSHDELEVRVQERTSELMESNRRLRAIFDHAFQFISLLRPDGTVLEVNQPALSFAGIALADVHDRPLWEARWWSGSPQGQKQLKSAIAGAARGCFVRYEVALCGGGDASVVADFSITPVRNGAGDVALLIAEARDITARKRLEREILETAARERQRVGQDLHDTLGQNLSSVAILSRALQKKLTARSPRQAEEAGHIAELAAQSAAQSREIARGLQPVEISEHGLMDALRELALNTQILFGIPCEFRCDSPVSVRDNHVATQLFHIAQEAVNNAVKHSGAKHIALSLSSGPLMISLRVRDDGSGLPPNVAESDGMGLRIMRHRAEEIGGFFDIRNVPPHGTIVSCCVRGPAPQTAP